MSAVVWAVLVRAGIFPINGKELHKFFYEVSKKYPILSNLTFGFNYGFPWSDSLDTCVSCAMIAHALSWIDSDRFYRMSPGFIENNEKHYNEDFTKEEKWQIDSIALELLISYRPNIFKQNGR